MGFSSSHSADAHSRSLEVGADADTLWSIVSDLEASAAAVAAVRDVAFLRRGDRPNNNHNQSNSSNSSNHNNHKFEVGTTVRETRVYKAKAYVCRRQIVAIDAVRSDCDGDDGDGEDSPAAAVVRSVSFSTWLDPETSSSVIRHRFSNTSTLTVVPLTDRTCELVGSMAATWSGMISNCWACCWKCVHGSTEDPFAAELEDLAAAAEKKFQEQQQSRLAS